jgi:predicted TPR repeat methyltransferase
MMSAPAPKEGLGHIDPHIAEALELGGDAQRILAFYEDWAENYDLDVGALGDDYQATATMVSFFTHLDLDGLGVGGTDIAILDAGCGTGLVGVALASAGYTVIDGVDLSPGMVKQAKRRGVYRELVGGFDLGDPTEERWRQAADVVFVCGVFTMGHAPPDLVGSCAELVRRGGLLVITTRKAYFDESGYQAHIDELSRQGRIECIAELKDAPYTSDSLGHVFAYQVN